MCRSRLPSRRALHSGQPLSAILALGLAKMAATKRYTTGQADSSRNDLRIAKASAKNCFRSQLPTFANFPRQLLRMNVFQEGVRANQPFDADLRKRASPTCSAGQWQLLDSTCKRHDQE